MKQIGLIYGSDGGRTKYVSERLANIIGLDYVELIDVSTTFAEQISSFDKLIFASSTWGEGDLQSDWEDFEEKLDEINFSNKTIALLGLGDQKKYGNTFVNAIFLLYGKVKDANVVGQTSTDGYDYKESNSVIDGKFIGLVIDEDNQDDLTQARLEKWVEQIKDDFGIK